VALALFGLGLARPAAAELGSTGAVTVAIGVGGGFQLDRRACDTAGSSRTTPTGQCVLWAGGLDLSLLWRGHLGASLGLWSVSGQAAVIPSAPDGPSPAAAFPDRVSLPLLFDLRPLSFFVAPGSSSYLDRVLYGLRLGLGPSIEIVRTASDSSLDWGRRIGEPLRSLVGMHASLDGELPLQSGPSGLSLRLSARLLYVPLVVLNDAAVQSAPVSTTDVTPAQLPKSFVGYASHAQLFLSLVYYL
jgi:hypothetical protein